MKRYPMWQKIAALPLWLYPLAILSLQWIKQRTWVIATLAVMVLYISVGAAVAQGVNELHQDYGCLPLSGVHMIGNALLWPVFALWDITTC